MVSGIAEPGMVQDQPTYYLTICSQGYNIDISDTGWGMIHYLLVGYLSGSTGGYYKPAQKPCLEEGELTVFLLLNIHTAFYMLMFLPVGLCFSRHWSAKASF